MTDIQKIEDPASLTKLDAKRAELQALAEKYSAVKIAGVNDKDGIEFADKARKELKAARCAIKNEAEAVRAPAVDFQKKVIAIEKELTEIVSKPEKAVEAELARIEAENRRILEEEAARQRAELNRRVQELAKVAYAHDIEELRVMDELDFEILLAEKTEDFKAAMERKEAEDRAAVSEAVKAQPEVPTQVTPEQRPPEEFQKKMSEEQAKQDTVEAQFSRFCYDRGITKELIDKGEFALKRAESGIVTVYRKAAVFVPVNPA